MALNFNDINVGSNIENMFTHVEQLSKLKPIMTKIFNTRVEGLPLFNYDPKLSESMHSLTYTFLNAGILTLTFSERNKLEIIIDFFERYEPGAITIANHEQYYQTLAAAIFRGVKKLNKYFKVIKIKYITQESRNKHGYVLNASTQCSVDILKILDFNRVLRITSEQMLRTVFKNPRFVKYCYDHHIQFYTFDNYRSLNNLMPLPSFIFERDYKTSLIYLKPR